ncbi:hypothetical protein [Parvibaculum sp.]|uniref:hypothetical protein n=1 Tax=Parvibaculum sp. TaxID=2024848 RepID=UPI0034A021A7
MRPLKIARLTLLLSMSYNALFIALFFWSATRPIESNATPYEDWTPFVQFISWIPLALFHFANAAIIVSAAACVFVQFGMPLLKYIFSHRS